MYFEFAKHMPSGSRSVFQHSSVKMVSPLSFTTQQRETNPNTYSSFWSVTIHNTFSEYIIEGESTYIIMDEVSFLISR